MTFISLMFDPISRISTHNFLLFKYAVIFLLSFMLKFTGFLYKDNFCACPPVFYTEHTDSLNFISNLFNHKNYFYKIDILNKALLERLKIILFFKIQKYKFSKDMFSQQKLRKYKIHIDCLKKYT